MAKIVNNIPKPKDKKSFEQGDLFINPDDNSIFILTRYPWEDENHRDAVLGATTWMWMAIALDDGNRWDEPDLSMKKALSGLKFLKSGDDVTITITINE